MDTILSLTLQMRQAALVGGLPPLEGIFDISALSGMQKRDAAVVATTSRCSGQLVAGARSQFYLLFAARGLIAR